MLVHMSRGEVKSLNDLAMAHGGHLSINPKTGLPEAGFLSKLLPMLAGGALMMVPGVGPIMAASLVGGGTALATGSLKKGLMAGLGAYGGAGLGQSLMSAGAAAAPAAVLPEAAAAVPEAAAATNPLQGLDVSGATTAGVTPAATAPAANGIAAVNPTAVIPAPASATPLPTGAGPLSGLDVSGTTTASLPPTTMAPTATQTTTPFEAGFEGTSAEKYTPFEAGFEGTSARIAPTFSDNMANMGRGFTGENLLNYATENPYRSAAMAASLYTPKDKTPKYQGDADMGQRYSYSADATNPLPSLDSGGREQKYFTPTYTKISDEEARSIYGYAGGGPVETMSNLNAIGANTGYPMADIGKGRYASPYQSPNPQNVLSGAQDIAVDPYTGQEQRTSPAPQAQFARGGLSSAASHLGDYSDGGRLLRGPGDGVSDSIPAMIGKKQPARLADGEFVVPARIVSELGNGSTEAGARKLYAMMDRVQAARKKSIGKGKVAKNSRADKLLPA
jgi:hypothetical protein